MLLQEGSQLLCIVMLVPLQGLLNRWDFNRARRGAAAAGGASKEEHKQGGATRSLAVFQALMLFAVAVCHALPL